ncbi:Cro/Cl family transcriptional regulator [Pseudomonas syringae pv. syringae]|uniref:helix-turn-helix domain-containing protein n=1 Tax=Pseudomonas syringae TaxID=317 RepID=UPI0007603350|nr:helix-turn-helix transcriptional regulator [Pseudomonas syringae]KWS17201.1 Cro/Cl family transcriptional regulator [Pseudomonas syringae pv. syringae]
MSLKIEVAAALRGIRQQRQLSYEDLAGGSLRTTIGALERAEAGVTFDKLHEIAEVLGFDLVTLVALCVGLKDGQEPQAIMEAAMRELQAFEASGGMELVLEQLEDGKLFPRAVGKPRKVRNEDAVLALKAQGKSPAEAVEILGLSRTTVSRYWRGDGGS